MPRRYFFHKLQQSPHSSVDCRPLLYGRGGRCYLQSFAASLRRHAATVFTSFPPLKLMQRLWGKEKKKDGNRNEKRDVPTRDLRWRMDSAPDILASTQEASAGVQHGERRSRSPSGLLQNALPGWF